MKSTAVFPLISLVSMALAVSCSLNSSRQPSESLQPQQLMETFAKDLAKKSEWVSFEWEHSSVDQEGVKTTYPDIYHLVYRYTDTFPAFYMTIDSMIWCRVSPYDVCMVDNYDNTLRIYHHVEDKETDWCFRTWKGQIESGWLGNISLFFQCATPDMPPAYGISYTGGSDTIVRGVPCVHVIGLTPMARWKAGEEEGISQVENHFWINKETGMLDSLVKIEIADTTRMGTMESVCIKNVVFEDKSAYIDSIFDFGSPRYDRFSVEDEHTWLRESIEPGKIGNGMYGFPMIDLQGDTCYLREFEGWKLLHFWCYRCSNCIRQLEEWGKEKDSLGYRYLQNEGIKLMSINYFSDNFELLRNTAAKTNSADIMYSSKGIDEFIRITSLGRNFLLSPSNEIVFQSPFIVGMDDYSELLEAKANYEKQHKNK